MTVRQNGYGYLKNTPQKCDSHLVHQFCVHYLYSCMYTVQQESSACFDACNKNKCSVLAVILFQWPVSVGHSESETVIFMLPHFYVQF